MKTNNIYIIQNKQHKNLVSIYTNFLRPKFEIKSTSFQLVSIKDKFQKRISLKEILEFDTTAQSLTVDTKKYISKMISTHNNENILELYKVLPDLNSFFDELTTEQKVIFSLLRSIIKKSETIIIEQIDNLVSYSSFQLIKKSIHQMSKEKKYNFIIETTTPEYWSDICNFYVNTKISSIELIENKLEFDTGKDTFKNEEIDYQIAL